MANTKTIGQALDEAIARHAEAYPGSDVYHVEVSGPRAGKGTLANIARIEVRASHFSRPLVYVVVR